MNTKGLFKTTVEAEHRDGICEVCGVQMVIPTELAPPEVLNVEMYDIPFDIQLPDELIERPKCPKCGGITGRLISRSVSIQAPDPPQCFRFSCLWNFYIRVVTCWLISNYHRRRVVYAEKRRHKKIPLKYRTGGDAPETIRQIIWGIIKLSIRR